MKLISVFLISLFSLSFAMEPTDDFIDISTCGICLGDLPGKWPEQISICSFNLENESQGEHTFCSQCLFRSIQTDNLSCPICRKFLSINQIHAIEMADFLRKISLVDRFSEDSMQKVIKEGGEVLNRYSFIYENEIYLLKAEREYWKLEAKNLCKEKKMLLTTLGNLNSLIAKNDVLYY